jgi:hypothetical protein
MSSQRSACAGVNQWRYRAEGPFESPSSVERVDLALHRPITLQNNSSPRDLNAAFEHRGRAVPASPLPLTSQARAESTGLRWKTFAWRQRP